MSEQLQLRRGTASQVAAFTGAAGELVVDTTNNRLVVQDGATAGGFPAVVSSPSLTTLMTAAHGAAIQFGVSEILLSALSGSSVTATAAIPANCIVFAVGAYVVTAITGATSYEVGVTGTLNQFGSGLSLAAGSSNPGLIGPTAFYAATNIILTAAGSNFTAGAVRISVHYAFLTPSTS